MLMRRAEAVRAARRRTRPGTRALEIRLGSAVSLALVAMTVSTGSINAAAADTVPTSLRGPHVIDYTGSTYTQDVMSGVQVVVLRGSRLADGGCAIPYQFTLKPVDHEITQEELQYDPDTCTSLVARGHLLMRDASYRQSSSGTTSLALFHGSSEGGGAGQPTGLPMTSQSPQYGGWYGDQYTVPSAPYSANTYRAYQDSWYDEPLRWVPPNKVTYQTIAPTTEELNAIEWTPGGGCGVAPGTTAWFSYYAFWLSETSWAQVPSSRYWQHPPSSLTCADRPFSQTDSSYENKYFCAATGGLLGGIVGGIIGAVNVTHAQYSPNYIYGYEDGSLNSYGVMYKDGLCGKLLREKHQTSYY
jgi:hypothetical protein